MLHTSISPEKGNLNSNFKSEKMTIQKYNVIVFDMAYRKNFSAESRNLLQFNGKSDIAHQDRCLEQTFFSSNDLLHKIEIVF